MPRYRVFVGAPTAQELLQDWEPREWSESTLTIDMPKQNAAPEGGPYILTANSVSNVQLTIPPSVPTSNNSSRLNSQPSWLLDVLPERTFIDANNKISGIYKNVIFGDDEEALLLSGQDPERSKSLDTSNVSDVSWEPSLSGGGNSERSFVKSAEVDVSKKSGFYSSFGDSSAEPDSQFDESNDMSGEGDSIGRFPTFHFSLHKLSSLGTVLKAPVRRKERKIVSLLVAVLEVDGPVSITTRAGVEMALLKLVVGDEAGAIAKITVWRETAEQWGGSEYGEGGLKRGDVVLLENIAVNYAPPAPPNLSASPTEKSTHTICYRTLPTLASDRQYRPDLRLGITDSAIRKVSIVVDWMEEMAGLKQR
ncbi:hypothetical protein FRC02_003012 [Tulasnella sp. 418]|nr:hypothetical protein FRC02_003012 [Tulasnella sp. 418]